MIRCIVSNKNKPWDQFSAALTKIITKAYPNLEIVLVQNIPYWKHPDSNEVVYSITNDALILVCDFIKIFDLTWVYTNSIVFYVENKVFMKKRLFGVNLIIH